MKLGGAEVRRCVGAQQRDGQVTRRPAVRVDPPELTAAPGDRVRFRFHPGGGVAYRVSCDVAAVRSWCRVVPPAGRTRWGEVVVDVPSDADPGRHLLRIVVASPRGEEAVEVVVLRVRGERCLRVLAAPVVELRPDGGVRLTLRVLNCGPVDVNLEVRARHEGGWSFAADPPELVVGVGDDPVVVSVTLRAPPGREVDPGEGITVEVDAGDGWQELPTRVPGRPRSWRLPGRRRAATAVAIAVGAAVAGFVVAGTLDDEPEEDRSSDAGGIVIVGGDNADDGGDRDGGGGEDDGGEGGDGGGGEDDGGGGDASIEVAELDLGEVTVGRVAERSVEVVNGGDDPVELDVEVDGDEAIGARSSCDVVDPGESCDLVVRFAPVVAGPAEARVAVGDQVVEVIGEGAERSSTSATSVSPETTSTSQPPDTTSTSETPLI